MGGLRAVATMFHVYTPVGEVLVPDDADADRTLKCLVVQYPHALVRTEDEGTGAVLAEDMPLIRLLAAER